MSMESRVEMLLQTLPKGFHLIGWGAFVGSAALIFMASSPNNLASIYFNLVWLLIIECIYNYYPFSSKKRY